MSDPSAAPSGPPSDAIAEDLRVLDAEAAALRAQGRHTEAAHLDAWRTLHAQRAAPRRG